MSKCNRKSQHSCCLSPARPNKQRQWLNLYGHFTQISGDLRRQRVFTLTDHLTFHFKVALFIRRTKCRQGVWNSGKSYLNLKTAAFSIRAPRRSWPRSLSVSWASGRLTLEDSGSDTILLACSPPEAQRWNCFWSPRVRVGPTSSSWNNSVLPASITKLSSYYLKLKISNFCPHPKQWVPFRSGLMTKWKFLDWKLGAQVFILW